MKKGGSGSDFYRCLIYFINFTQINGRINHNKNIPPSTTGYHTTTIIRLLLLVLLLVYALTIFFIAVKLWKYIFIAHACMVSQNMSVYFDFFILYPARLQTHCTFIKLFV